MKRAQSGEGVTDVSAALGGSDHVIPDIEVQIEPTRRLEGAPPGDRPTEVRLIGDRRVPVSPRLAEVEEGSAGVVETTSDLEDARGYVVRALSEGVLTLAELHLCNALVRVIDFLVALQEET